MSSILIEYINTTNQSIPHFEKHQSYVTDVLLYECGLVQSLSFEERCNFVQNTEDCDSDSIFNYLELMYCIFKPKNVAVLWIYIFLLVLVQMYMFWILGTAADKFFCPALQIVANLLGMSQNLAGVTLLAFGNGSSDFFTSLATLTTGEVSPYAPLMGSVAFVSMAVGGVVVITKPFKIDQFPFLRDMGFLLLSVIYIDYAIKSDKVITLIESVLMLTMYLTYLAVLITNEILLRLAEKELLKQIKQDDENETLLEELEIIRREIGRKSPETEIPIINEKNNGKNYKIIQQFLGSINPLDLDEWKESSAFLRIFMIFKIPMMLALLILIPIADEEQDLCGWTKLLNCLHLIILPLFLVENMVGDSVIFGMPVIYVSLCVTVPMAIATLYFTRTDQKPKFHFIFALLSIVGAIFIIYIIANEIIAILLSLGLVTSRSQSFLGCTTLAWGNSIGDLMADTALARAGFPFMAFSACIGGPFFYSVVGYSITCLYNTILSETHSFQATQGSLGENCVTLVIIGLCLTLFGTYLTNYNARRSIGLTMISFYCILFFFCILSETKIMHQFGTDHSQDNSISST